MIPVGEMPTDALTSGPKAVDRPSWIPEHITEGWDPDPYAYQTEEEIMPQGGPHDEIIFLIRELINPVLEGRGLMSLSDVFIIFRNESGVQQRTNKAADVMVVPVEKPVPKAWYLDKRPAPLVTMEVPSEPDEEAPSKKDVFIDHGTRRHVVVDQLDERGEVADEVRIRVWGPDKKEQEPDREGFLDLPEIGLKVKPSSPREEFTFYDRDTLEPRKRPNVQLAETNAELKQRAKAMEEMAAEIARLRAELEKRGEGQSGA